MKVPCWASCSIGYPRYRRMPLPPSMKVIALRQDAVLRKAGSLDISPKSSGSTLICRRSMARIVPSVIGISYCFPVRLSVIVSVSAMSVESAREVRSQTSEVRSQESGKPRSLGEGGRALPPVRSGPVRLVVVVGIGHGRGLSSHPIPPVHPVPEVEQLAPFAAEWPPLRRDRPCPAVYADRMTDHDQCVGV